MSRRCQIKHKTMTRNGQSTSSLIITKEIMDNKQEPFIPLYLYRYRVFPQLLTARSKKSKKNKWGKNRIERKK